MDQKQIDSVIEGIKGFVRAGLIGAVPVAILQLQQGYFDLKPVVLAFTIAVLIGLEHGLHEDGLNTGEMNPVSKALELK